MCYHSTCRLNVLFSGQNPYPLSGETESRINLGSTSLENKLLVFFLGMRELNCCLGKETGDLTASYHHLQLIYLFEALPLLFGSPVSESAQGIISLGLFR